MTGENLMLVLNQCVYFRTRLKHSLICRNQLRAHGVVVDDIPRQFEPKSQHAIIHHGLTIPLDMSGVVSYFETRAPKPWKIDSLKQIVLTSDTDWESFSETVPSSEVRNPIYVSSLSTQVSHGPLVPSAYQSTLRPEFLDDNELSEQVLAFIWRQCFGCVHN
jgi:hypothetical protein